MRQVQAEWNRDIYASAVRLWAAEAFSLLEGKLYGGAGGHLV